MNAVVERASHHGALFRERQIEALHMEHYKIIDVRSRQPQVFVQFTSDKHLAVTLAWLFLSAIFPYLFGILVLPFDVSFYMWLLENFRTISEGRRTVLQALPLSTSPAAPMCETLSASDEA